MKGGGAPVLVGEQFSSSSSSSLAGAPEGPPVSVVSMLPSRPKVSLSPSPTKDSDDNISPVPDTPFLLCSIPTLPPSPIPFQPEIEDLEEALKTLVDLQSHHIDERE